MAVLRALVLGTLLSASSFVPVARADDDPPSEVADASLWQEHVRLTFYTLRGTMRWGNQTNMGAAACGNHFPAGSQLQFATDNWTVMCEDTGRLLSNQIDVWAPSYAWGVQNIARAYGDYTIVKVIRWGW